MADFMPLSAGSPPATLVVSSAQMTPAPKQHPLLCTPNLLDLNNLAFPDYSKAPDITPIDCLLGDAEQVAHQLHGSAGCSGVDTKHLKNKLLKHSKASAKLHKELVECVLWLANTMPPWASYQAMHQGHLLSHMAMLWEVWHRWPAGSCFAYNLYCHECHLILRGPPGTEPVILVSQEGVMQCHGNG
ncbi:hypothetical protein ACHAW6_001649 [Cyclotella cf. meneghiniana]